MEPLIPAIGDIRSIDRVWYYWDGERWRTTEDFHRGHEFAVNHPRLYTAMALGVPLSELPLEELTKKP